MRSRKAILSAILGILFVSGGAAIYWLVVARSAEQPRTFAVKLNNASGKEITRIAIRAHDEPRATIFVSSQSVEPKESVSFLARYIDVARAWRITITFDDGAQISGTSAAIQLEGPLRVAEGGQKRPDGGIAAKVYTSGLPRERGESVLSDIQSYEITVTADEIRTSIVESGIEVRLEEGE